MQYYLGVRAGKRGQCWDAQSSFEGAMIVEDASQLCLCFGFALSPHKDGDVSMC